MRLLNDHHDTLFHDYVFRSRCFFEDRGGAFYHSLNFFARTFLSDLFLIISFPHALFYKPKIDSRVIFLLFAELFWDFSRSLFTFVAHSFTKDQGKDQNQVTFLLKINLFQRSRHTHTPLPLKLYNKRYIQPLHSLTL